MNTQGAASNFILLTKVLRFSLSAWERLLRLHHFCSYSVLKAQYNCTGQLEPKKVTHSKKLPSFFLDHIQASSSSRKEMLPSRKMPVWISLGSDIINVMRQYGPSAMENDSSSYGLMIYPSAAALFRPKIPPLDSFRTDNWWFSGFCLAFVTGCRLILQSKHHGSLVIFVIANHRWFYWNFGWARPFIQISGLRCICELSTGVFRYEKPKMILFRKSDQKCYHISSKFIKMFYYSMMKAVIGDFCDRAIVSD